MNKTKRRLELIAAIFSIVLGAILALGSVALLVGINGLQGVEGAEQELQAVGDMLKVITVIVLIGAIVIVLLGILLCVPPKSGKTGRVAVKIALTVIVGVVAVLELVGKSPLYFVLFGVPFVLLIISMCMKDKKVEDTDNLVNPEPENSDFSQQ